MFNLEDIDIDTIFAVIGSTGVRVVDVRRNMGEDVIETPDGAICSVVDAPAVEFWRDGLIFDERGVCVGKWGGMSEDALIALMSNQGLLSEYQAEKLMPFIQKTANQYKATSFVIEASKRGYTVLDIIEFFKDGDWEDQFFRSGEAKE